MKLIHDGAVIQIAIRNFDILSRGKGSLSVENIENLMSF